MGHMCNMRLYKREQPEENKHARYKKQPDFSNLVSKYGSWPPMNVPDSTASYHESEVVDSSFKYVCMFSDKTPGFD